MVSFLHITPLLRDVHLSCPEFGALASLLLLLPFAIFMPRALRVIRGRHLHSAHSDIKLSMVGAARSSSPLFGGQIELSSFPRFAISAQQAASPPSVRVRKLLWSLFAVQNERAMKGGRMSFHKQSRSNTLAIHCLTYRDWQTAVWSMRDTAAKSPGLKSTSTKQKEMLTQIAIHTWFI